MWAITPEERGKHDKQFDSLAPLQGYVSGRLLSQQTCSIKKKTKKQKKPSVCVCVIFCLNMSGFCCSLGEQARKFFLQSGLPPSVLAEIWLVIPRLDNATRKRSYFVLPALCFLFKTNFLRGSSHPPVISLH